MRSAPAKRLIGLLANRASCSGLQQAAVAMPAALAASSRATVRTAGAAAADAASSVSFSRSFAAQPAVEEAPAMFCMQVCDAVYLLGMEP